MVRVIAGEAVGLLSIIAMVVIALWLPYLSAAPDVHEIKYEVRK